MSSLGAGLQEIALEWFESEFLCAVLRLDAQGRVLEIGGRPELLELPKLEVGRPLQEQLLFIDGLIPMETKLLCLPSIQVSPYRMLHVRLTRTAEGYGVVISDAAPRAREVLALRSSLRTQASETRSARASETTDASLAERSLFLSEQLVAVGVAAFRVDAAGRLRLESEVVPKWLELLPALSPCIEEPALPVQTDGFVDHFLFDARALWEGDSNGYVSSGPWCETDFEAQEHLFEAVAVKTHSASGLWISHETRFLRERRALLQRGRELAKERAELLQLRSELTAGRVALEAKVAERTQRLHEANAKLLEELQLRRSLEHEQHEMFRRLEQARKMETIGTLAGGIAHDFNNILSAILGYTELSLDATPEDSILRQNLDQVMAATLRARDLTRQILVFSRQAEPSKRPVQLVEVVEEALGLIEASLPARISVERRIESHAYVLADPVQMHQVVMNLLTNAVQAMSRDPGTLSVALREVCEPGWTGGLHGTAPPGSYVELIVRDTGTGIAPALVHRIFEPFYTTKPAGEGTGMGLSVVQGIVQEAQGTIQLQSQQGKGSVFTVRIPVLDSAKLLELSDKQLRRGEGRILLISDKAVHSALMQQMLTCLGYQVTHVRHDSEAAGVLSESECRFDLAIADMDRSRGRGLILSTELLRSAPRTPILFCCDDDAGRASPARAEDEAYLVRPIAMHELADACHALMQPRPR